MSCTCTDTATLAFTLDGAGLTTATTNQWKIKVVFCKCVISHDAAVPSQVTQLSCDDETVASQQGCFQYHTGITGNKHIYFFLVLGPNCSSDLVCLIICLSG